MSKKFLLILIPPKTSGNWKVFSFFFFEFSEIVLICLKIFKVRGSFSFDLSNHLLILAVDFCAHFRVFVREVQFLILFAIGNQFSRQSVTRMGRCLLIFIISVAETLSRISAPSDCYPSFEIFIVRNPSVFGNFCFLSWAHFSPVVGEVESVTFLAIFH